MYLHRAAPLLKDAPLAESKSRELYLDVILMVRRLYHECKLIHGDLSEFNMLWVQLAFQFTVSQLTVMFGWCLFLYNPNSFFLLHMLLYFLIDESQKKNNWFSCYISSIVTYFCLFTNSMQEGKILIAVWSFFNCFPFNLKLFFLLLDS